MATNTALIRARRRARHIESGMQQACVRWFAYQHPELDGVLFAVPNGGTRKAAEAARLKAEGVVAGVSDLILLTSRGGWGALCIEMKTADGRPSPRQIWWREVAEHAGNKYVVCRSVEDFVREVETYLAEE